MQEQLMPFPVPPDRQGIHFIQGDAYASIPVA